MSFRSGQSGNVVKKGKLWCGRYYIDVLGQERRKRTSITLGSIQTMNKAEAKRKLRAILQESGLNDSEHLEHVNKITRTFAQEAQWWRENRLSLLKPSCQETMGSHLTKYLIPRIGTESIAAIDERRVQELIAELARTTYTAPNGVHRLLSPKSIHNIVGLLLTILGEDAWRPWKRKLRFPEPPAREQRYFTPEEMQAIVNASVGVWRPMFALLGATGVRCGEAFALRVEDLDLSAGLVHVRRSNWCGQDLNTKTKAGVRAIEIGDDLVQILHKHVGDRKSGRLFTTRTGSAFSKNNVRRKLRETLKKLGLPMGGLHAFRHGRASQLQAQQIPGDLVTKWIGHTSLRVTSRYTHFDQSYRRQMANDLKLFDVGPNGPAFDGVEELVTA